MRMPGVGRGDPLLPRGRRSPDGRKEIWTEVRRQKSRPEEDGCMLAHRNWTHAFDSIKFQFLSLRVEDADDGYEKVPDERKQKEYNPQQHSKYANAQNPCDNMNEE